MDEPLDDNLFADPEDYYPPTPPPTTQTHTTRAGHTITLHLVGHSALEAHRLWNGARAVADRFEADPALVRGRSVLELGAAAGLPSIVAASLGARRVVVTDFPDPDILEAMERNVRGCALVPDRDGDYPGTGEKANIVVAGYVWGADARPLLALLRDGDAGVSSTGEEKDDDDDDNDGFDVLVLADLLFRHSEHGHIADSVEATLKRRRASRAFVVFTSYRPWLAHKDLAFFDVARERGFLVEQVLELKTEKPMFEDDPGDEEVRKTVLGFTLRWPEEVCKD